MISTEKSNNNSSNNTNCLSSLSQQIICSQETKKSFYTGEKKHCNGGRWQLWKSREKKTEHGRRKWTTMFRTNLINRKEAGGFWVLLFYQYVFSSTVNSLLSCWSEDLPVSFIAYAKRSSKRDSPRRKKKRTSLQVKDEKRKISCKENLGSEADVAFQCLSTTLIVLWHHQWWLQMSMERRMCSAV